MIHRDKRRRNKQPHCLYDIMKILKGTRGPTVRTLKETECWVSSWGGGGQTFFICLSCAFLYLEMSSILNTFMGRKVSEGQMEQEQLCLGAGVRYQDPSLMC